ncbi:MAG TPA: PQQ-binding-like beta-propeller repeat protein [Dokdonella sp.]|uniref:outer membrane protein assembly factor BamB family protein n=1 Tax=Dokdonella sp. TaxID=2291710 RepID=UPI002D80D9FE|nr:PQQ-binding-like beta-propeller repeat protein [Dokdonella sp.]HET9032111.1 PQQ-binding-like beta-propeller repeat protein [Dokdonella sp.]
MGMASFSSDLRSESDPDGFSGVNFAIGRMSRMDIPVFLESWRFRSSSNLLQSRESTLMGHSLIRSFVLAALAACVMPTHSANAEVLWSSPWTYSTPMPLRATEGVDLSFTANGGVIVGSIANTGFDRETIRVNANGSVQWTSSLYGYRNGFDQKIGTAIEMEDGGTIVTLGSDWPYVSGEITRLDTSRNLLWSRRALVNSIARLGTSRLAYSQCNTLSVADVQTGNVVWQHAFDRDKSCTGDSASVVDSDNIYASFGISTGFYVTGYRVIKTDADGNVAWNISAQLAKGGSVVAAGAGVVYLQTEMDLRALSEVDGSTLWSTPTFQHTKVLLSKDPSSDPIILDYNSIRRLSSSSGTEIWNLDQTSCGCSSPSLIGNSLIALTSQGLGLTKLDATTGTTIWSTTLPTEDANSQPLTWQGFGGLFNNHLLGVATAYAGGATTAHFQGIDFTTGVMTPEMPSPQTDQGVYASSLADGNDVFNAAYGSDQNGKTLRLRRLDALTGAPAWEKSVPALPVEEIYYYPSFFDQWPSLIVNDDSIAISYSASSYSYITPGLTYVTLFDRATGNLRWSKLLQEPGQALTYSSLPEFDSTGNVFIGVGTNLPCGFNDYCGRKFIYKLAAQTGDVQWRFDNTVPPTRSTQGAGQVFPQDFEVFNNDVVVAGVFFGNAHTLLRLSGADASLMWSSDLFSGAGYNYGFYRQDDQHIIFYGAGQNARVDIGDGSVLWTITPSPSTCTQGCNGYDQLVLPDGDLIAVGEGDSKPYVARLHNDGSGSIDRWQLDPNDPSLRSSVSFVRKTPSGRIMLQGRRSYRRSVGALSILFEIDPTNGAVLSQQVLHPGANDATSDVLSPIVTEFTQDNQMLFNGFRISETKPWTSGAGLLDTTISEHGNLQLSITTDRRHVAEGQTLGFQLLATYAGDQPISGAHLFAGTALQGGVLNLTCDLQSASNCNIDDRSGNIDATFDIQPGGSVTISGELTVVEESESYYLSGTVSGPVSLSESNTIDNFSRANIVQPLFANGFESPLP